MESPEAASTKGGDVAEPDGRTLAWTDVLRRQECSTVEAYAIDGVPISDDELRQRLLGR